MQNRVIASAHAKLGIAYALLGESFSAVAEGSKAVSRLSVSDDAYDGANHLRDLVLIYTLIGARTRRSRNSRPPCPFRRL